MVTIPSTFFFGMNIILLLLFWYYIRTVIIFAKCRLKGKTAKKWKKICKMEHRTSVEQEHYVIERFIEQYSEEHNIIWNE